MGAKAGKKSGGRKKGTPNKVNGEFKDMLFDALIELGGVSYLVEQGRKDVVPAGLFSMWAKLMPKESTVEVTHKVQMFEIVMTGNKALEEKPVEGVVIDG